MQHSERGHVCVSVRMFVFLCPFLYYLANKASVSFFNYHHLLHNLFIWEETQKSLSVLLLFPLTFDNIGHGIIHIF